MHRSVKQTVRGSYHFSCPSFVFLNGLDLTPVFQGGQAGRECRKCDHRVKMPNCYTHTCTVCRMTVKGVAEFVLHLNDDILKEQYPSRTF